jgi:hypothetical protein
MASLEAKGHVLKVFGLEDRVIDALRETMLLG